MSLLKILKYPEEVLKQKAKPVEAVTAELQKLASDMLETMYAAPGIGLAAPQVGHSIRLTVIDIRMRDENGQVDEASMTELEKKISMPLILFNPEIIKKDGKTTFEEGCLSVPGYFETVHRSNYIQVQALNESGEKINFETDGLLAICIQHEIDHLDGKLFIDRLSTVKRGIIKSKIKKHGYPSQESQKEHIL
ncbi:MAG: peptide deformylase [Oligoflexia bacterium]|nr:peptide deformylase [Oligoflexia bacterium]